MILADIQTTFGVMLWLFCLFAWLFVVVAVLVLRALGRALHKSYQKGGGTPQLVRNVGTKGLGLVLRRMIFKC